VSFCPARPLFVCLGVTIHFGLFLLPGGRPRLFSAFCFAAVIQAGGLPRRFRCPSARSSRAFIASEICSRVRFNSAIISFKSMWSGYRKKRSAYCIRASTDALQLSPSPNLSTTRMWVPRGLLDESTTRTVNWPKPIHSGTRMKRATLWLTAVDRPFVTGAGAPETFAGIEILRSCVRTRLGKR
jgi:hypothetical protein